MEPQQCSSNDVKEEETFNILVATDCHLGYAERDPVRSTDSITTFEEILSIAKEKKVDFILLGGDLFHENKPSRKVLHDCVKLLRKYCMGDHPVQIEFLSDQSENFKDTGVVNYEDPNLNISIPVFSIHGNHDDPAGLGVLSALDLFSVSGIVNYFGKCTDLSYIQISPLLMQKGKTKLALYGLGAVRDERLHRLFRDRKVSMLRPRENASDWFNLFVLHQNRARHGATNYIPEQFLDDFLDLVIWGHEHECRIKPEWNSYQNFFVSQPGSPIATSLSPGEAVPKHVGLLYICKKNFKMEKIPLQTVRQFYIDTVDLNSTSLNPEDVDIQERVMDYCRERVEELLNKAEIEHSGNVKQPKKPLIRLRVEHDEQFESFSIRRFGQNYVDRVANPKDILLFHRKRKIKHKDYPDIDVDVLNGVLKPELLETSRVEDLIREYFQKADDDKQLFLLTENGMKLAIQEFVDKDVKFAIDEIVNRQLKKVQNYLTDNDVEDNAIDEEIYKFKKERQKTKEEESELQSIFKESNNKPTMEKGGRSSDDELDSNFSNLAFNTSTAARGRGRGSRSRARGRAKTSTLSSMNSNTSVTNGYGRGRGQSGSSRSRKKQSFNNTLEYAFQKQVRQSHSRFQSSDDDEIMAVSSEEDNFNAKRQKNNKSKSSRKRGIAFDSDDSM